MSDHTPKQPDELPANEYHATPVQEDTWARLAKATGIDPDRIVAVGEIQVPESHGKYAYRRIAWETDHGTVRSSDVIAKDIHPDPESSLSEPVFAENQVWVPTRAYGCEPCDHTDCAKDRHDLEEAELETDWRRTD